VCTPKLVALAEISDGAKPGTSPDSRQKNKKKTKIAKTT